MNKTYTTRIPNDIGAYLMELRPILRFKMRFFVSLISSKLAPTVRIYYPIIKKSESTNDNSINNGMTPHK